MFEIEKGIPIHNNGRHGPPGMYPFEEMEVGDSFFVPAGEIELRQMLKRVRVACCRGKLISGHKFCSHSVPAENGIRVWRVE